MWLLSRLLGDSQSSVLYCALAFVAVGMAIGVLLNRALELRSRRIERRLHDDFLKQEPSSPEEPHPPTAHPLG